MWTCQVASVYWGGQRVTTGRTVWPKPTSEIDTRPRWTGRERTPCVPTSNSKLPIVYPTQSFRFSVSIRVRDTTAEACKEHWELLDSRWRQPSNLAGGATLFKGIEMGDTTLRPSLTGKKFKSPTPVSLIRGRYVIIRWICSVASTLGWSPTMPCHWVSALRDIYWMCMQITGKRLWTSAQYTQ